MVLLGRTVRFMLVRETQVVCLSLPRTWRLTLPIQVYTDRFAVGKPE